MTPSERQTIIEAMGKAASSYNADAIRRGYVAEWPLLMEAALKAILELADVRPISQETLAFIETLRGLPPNAMAVTFENGETLTNQELIEDLKSGKATHSNA
jgi:hypothetical protein